MSMFSHKLISLVEMDEIKRIQDQSGQKHACEELICLLLRRWRSETYNQFLEVLTSCSYEECRAQLQSNLISALLWISPLASCFPFSSLYLYFLLSIALYFVIHISYFSTESYEIEHLAPSVAFIREITDNAYQSNGNTSPV